MPVRNCSDMWYIFVFCKKICHRYVFPMSPVLIFAHDLVAMCSQPAEAGLFLCLFFFLSVDSCHRVSLCIVITHIQVNRFCSVNSSTCFHSLTVTNTKKRTASESNKLPEFLKLYLMNNDGVCNTQQSEYLQQSFSFLIPHAENVPQSRQSIKGSPYHKPWFQTGVMLIDII